VEVNITEANHVNIVLRALMQQPFAPDKTREAQAEVLMNAAAQLADRAHRALSAGLTPQDVLDAMQQPEPLPLLDAVVDNHGNPRVRLGPDIEAAFLCYRTGTVGFLAQATEDNPPSLTRLVEMLSDAAVAVVRSAGIEPPPDGA
jgi:hypothetical protein